MGPVHLYAQDFTVIAVLWVKCMLKDNKDSGYGHENDVRLFVLMIQELEYRKE